MIDDRGAAMLARLLRKGQRGGGLAFLSLQRERSCRHVMVFVYGAGVCLCALLVRDQPFPACCFIQPKTLGICDSRDDSHVPILSVLSTCGLEGSAWLCALSRVFHYRSLWALKPALPRVCRQTTTSPTPGPPRWPGGSAPTPRWST